MTIEYLGIPVQNLIQRIHCFKQVFFVKIHWICDYWYPDLYFGRYPSAAIDSIYILQIWIYIFYLRCAKLSVTLCTIGFMIFVCMFCSRRKCRYIFFYYALLIYEPNTNLLQVKMAYFLEKLIRNLYTYTCVCVGCLFVICFSLFL